MDLMTVTGPVKHDCLGIILPHEHLFIDLRNQFSEFADEEKRRISQQPLCMRNLGAVRVNPYAIRDNLLLDDLDTAATEVEAFQSLGGRTIVDCTSVGIARDARALRALAERTGLNIVAGCGYYTYDTHPSDFDTWSLERIADEMLRDVLEGIDDTGVRAGIYGEIGTSDPIRPNEIKALLATARAFREHPLEVQVHTYPWGQAGREASRLLIDAGVDPGRIVICHTDIEFCMEYIVDLLKLGVNIEFDNFGKEFTIPKADRGFAGGIFARDIDRVRVLRELLDQDFEAQLLVTNDICLKSLLRAYGGYGYDHILRQVVPLMKEFDISDNTIDALLRRNPARILCG